MFGRSGLVKIVFKITFKTGLNQVGDKSEDIESHYSIQIMVSLNIL